MVAATSLRLYSQGPDWGLELAQAADGGVLALEVRGHGVAWEQHVRPGDRVVSISGVDAHAFIGQQIGSPHEIIITDARGITGAVRSPELSGALKLWLPAVAVLFALLGAVVYRWSLDASIGWIFLLFGGTTGLALASIAAALRGYAPTHFLAASSATVASAAFTTLFLWFPRPVSGARWLTNALAVASAALVLPLVVLYSTGEGTPTILETSLFVWMGGNLLVGTLLLSWRAIQPANRYVVAPLALGIAVGIFPLAFLDALPQAFGREPLMWPDTASATVVAIPLGFTYTILRHRLFALDAHVRRFTFRAFAALALVAIFVPTWLVVQSTGLDDQLAIVVAVLLVALAAPTIFDRAERLLERWFYAPLGLARAGLLTHGAASASSIAQALVVRGRELVPTRWVALVVHDSARARDGHGWAVLASDGDLPETWPPPDELVSLVTLRQDVPAMTVLALDGSPAFAAVVCVGPRLDGTPPGGVDLETIRLLSERVVPFVEAAVLRERAQGQTRFRRGLWQLARELSAVGPEAEVLRVTAQHAAILLGAERATVLQRNTAGGEAYAPVDNLPDLHGPEELQIVVQLDVAARDRSGYVSYMTVPDKPSMLVCWLGALEPAEALLVLSRSSAFTDEDARRAVEIAEHASVALRRSRVEAEAAEARALREVDSLRHELMSTVAHELRNPLTCVLGYAQMLQRRAGTLTRREVARIATQIEQSAAATRDVVRDLSTATQQRSGQQEVRVDSVDLSTALPTIARSFQLLPGGDRIVVDVPSNIRTRADHARLDQMIGNLLHNALRAGGNGQIILRARLAGPGEVWIEVRGQGTGISLPMVRPLAELHGGRVELTDGSDSESTLRIVLPRATTSLPGVVVASR